ncbi:MAG TPA: diguanylate cyclase [Spirochaetota bacterium]|nr:diguanylate cyclase [Spirochaetota bacterium]HPJ34019.1 diguanylate cyclase [Spirochaetota bacterium]
MRIDDEIYRELIDEASDPICSFFRDGTFRYVNRAFAESTGRRMEDVIGRRLWDVFPREEAESRYEIIRYVFETGRQKAVEQKTRVDDSTIYYLTTVKPLFDDSGNVSVVICMSKNITDLKHAEERLQYYATTDDFTGFVNRRTGLAILDKIHEFSLRSGKAFAVCYVDINDLKNVNDTYGHAEGDELIAVACDAMRDSVRHMDTVCRMGGDEFLIIFPECDLADAELIWDRITEKIDYYNSKSTKPYMVSMSHGILEYSPASGGSIESLLRRVDELMYREKRDYKQSRSHRDGNGEFY